MRRSAIASSSVVERCTKSSPYVATSWWIRFSAMSSEPIIARKSPSVTLGVRWLERMILQTSSTSSPRRLIFTGGSSRPSW